MLAEQPHGHPGNAIGGNGQFPGMQMPFPPGEVPPMDHYGGTPLFQRLSSGTDHMGELEECQRHLEQTKAALADSQRMNADLERRLENQGMQRMNLEAELNSAHQNHQVEIEKKNRVIEEWTKEADLLQQQNKRLRENMARLERELQGVLARKYDMREQIRRDARREMIEEEAIKKDLGRLQEKYDRSNTGDRANRSMQDHRGHPREIRSARALQGLDGFLGI